MNVRDECYVPGTGYTSPRIERFNALGLGVFSNATGVENVFHSEALDPRTGMELEFWSIEAQ